MWLSLVTCSYILLRENDEVGNFPVHTMHEITSETPLTSIRPHVGWEQCSPTAHKLYSLRHTTKEINWKWNTANWKSLQQQHTTKWAGRKDHEHRVQHNVVARWQLCVDLLHCLQSTYCTIFSKSLSRCLRLTCVVSRHAVTMPLLSLWLQLWTMARIDFTACSATNLRGAGQL